MGTIDWNALAMAASMALFALAIWFMLEVD